MDAGTVDALLASSAFAADFADETPPQGSRRRGRVSAGRSVLVTGGAGFIGSSSCATGFRRIRTIAWWCSTC